MAKDRLAGDLAVILHADVVGSTALVRKDESLAHDRIQAAFRLICQALRRYGGTVHEIRGDALVAEFSRASDAMVAALAAQRINHQTQVLIQLADHPEVARATLERLFAELPPLLSGVDDPPKLIHEFTYLGAL